MIIPGYLRRSATEAQPGLDLEAELRASVIEFDHMEFGFEF